MTKTTDNSQEVAAWMESLGFEYRTNAQTAIMELPVLAWVHRENGLLVFESLAAFFHQAMQRREVEARLRAALSVRGDYLFMMNTHDFGRPFSYEKVLQVTKDAYSELETQIAALRSGQEGERVYCNNCQTWIEGKDRIKEHDEAHNTDKPKQTWCRYYKRPANNNNGLCSECGERL